MTGWSAFCHSGGQCQNNVCTPGVFSGTQYEVNESVFNFLYFKHGL